VQRWLRDRLRRSGSCSLAKLAKNCQILEVLGSLRPLRSLRESSSVSSRQDRQDRQGRPTPWSTEPFALSSCAATSCAAHLRESICHNLFSRQARQARQGFPSHLGYRVSLRSQAARLPHAQPGSARVFFCFFSPRSPRTSRTAKSLKYWALCDLGALCESIGCNLFSRQGAKNAGSNGMCAAGSDRPATRFPGQHV